MQSMLDNNEAELHKDKKSKKKKKYYLQIHKDSFLLLL